MAKRCRATLTKPKHYFPPPRLPSAPLGKAAGIFLIGLSMDTATTQNHPNLTPTAGPQKLLYATEKVSRGTGTHRPYRVRQRSSVAPKRPLPAPERLRELFAYEPRTGDLRPLRLRRGPVPHQPADNRTQITRSIDGRGYLAHHIIWAMVHCVWPQTTGQLIVHLDGDGCNNRLENLALTAMSEIKQGV
jgi:hypothetical protein